MSYATADHDGIAVETNTGDVDAIRTSLGAPVAEPTTTGDEPVAEPTAAESEPPPAAATATGPERNPDGTFKAKPKKGSLDRLIWEREEAERKTKAAEARIAAIEAELAEARKLKPASGEPAKAAEPPARPKFSFPSYDAYLEQHPEASYEEYVEDRAVARIRHEQAIETATREAKAQHEAARTAVTAHQAREAKVRETYADYDTRVQAADALLAKEGLQLSPALSKAIVESERSADIVYDLASHPEVILQLARDFADAPLTVASGVRRLLESRLAGAPSGSPARPAVSTTAKPLIKPVSATPDVPDPSGEYSDDEPIEKHIARENARDRKAGRL